MRTRRSDALLELLARLVMHHSWWDFGAKKNEEQRCRWHCWRAQLINEHDCELVPSEAASGNRYWSQWHRAAEQSHQHQQWTPPGSRSRARAGQQESHRV